MARLVTRGHGVHRTTYFLRREARTVSGRNDRRRRISVEAAALAYLMRRIYELKDVGAGLDTVGRRARRSRRGAAAPARRLQGPACLTTTAKTVKSDATKRRDKLKDSPPKGSRAWATLGEASQPRARVMASLSNTRQIVTGRIVRLDEVVRFGGAT